MDNREAPERIWVMPCLEGFWCDEKQHDNDIEYIRSDKYAELEKKLEIAVEMLGLYGMDLLNLISDSPARTSRLSQLASALNQLNGDQNEG